LRILADVLSESSSNPMSSTAPPSATWVKGFFWSRADGQTRHHFAALVERLAAAGLKINEAEPPFDVEHVLRNHRTIMAVDVARYHQKRFDERSENFGRNIARLIREGQQTSAVDYEAALEHLARLRTKCASSFGSYDVWIMPATPAAAPCDLTTTGDPSFNSPWSYLGLPAVAAPYGLTEEGMPLGVQLVARTAQSAIALAERWGSELIATSMLK
jgi:Asp-tRNA(Asn)/Glu-tRNA(Gln) amidotransferase A subunit family amidase